MPQGCAVCTLLSLTAPQQSENHRGTMALGTIFRPDISLEFGLMHLTAYMTLYMERLQTYYQS